MSGTNAQIGWRSGEGQQGPVLSRTLRNEAKGAVSWEEPIPPSLLFQKVISCLKEERRQTDYLAVHLADSQASPTSPHRGSGRQSDVSYQQCPPPHSWSSPSPSAQEQGADALPYHSLLPTSKRAKGQSSHKASPSPGCQAPGHLQANTNSTS